MGILAVKNLTLRFNGKYLLNNLTIDFKEGYIHAIVGPNGAGKTTFAHTIMGLPDYTNHQGDIFLDGESIKDLPVDKRARKGITLGWQEPARFEGISVYSFIMAAAKKKEEEEFNRVLSMVGLDPGEYKTRAVDKTLSGGERKRIELASIIAMQPRVMLMDEPDSGIDIEAIEYIFKVIKYLKEKGTTIILITHSANVLKQADYAFLLCHGELVDKGKINKMIAYFEGKCLPCTHKNAPFQEEGQP